MWAELAFESEAFIIKCVGCVFFLFHMVGLAGLKQFEGPDRKIQLDEGVGCRIRVGQANSSGKVYVS